MLYRGWTIRTHQTYLGYFAQYTSPMGLPRQAGGSFATDEQAIAYAQLLVDQLLLRERLALRDASPSVLAG